MSNKSNIISDMVKKVFNSKLFFFTDDIYIKKLVFYGLLIRFLAVVIFYTNTSIFPDSYCFMEFADYMRQLDLSGYIGKRSPGYPLLIFLALGSNSLTVIYQFFIGVITYVFLYKTAINLKFSKHSSFIIAIFAQSFLTVFFYETSILVESLSLFLMVLLAYEISKGYLSGTSFKTDLYITVIVSYLVLIKPFFAYIAFLIYGLYLLNNFKWRKIISQKLVLLIFPVAIYFGWSYVNKITTGHFVSTSYFGLNMSQNCVYFAEKGPKKYNWIIEPYVRYRGISVTKNKEVAMAIWEAYNNEMEVVYPNFPDFSAELGKYAIETIKMNPTDYLKQVVFRSWFDFWKPRIFLESEKFNFKYANEIFMSIWYVQSLIIILINLFFVGISFYYMWDFLKTKTISFEFFAVVLVWVSSVLQAVVTYGTNARYRFPFEFLIILVVLLFLRNKNLFPERLKLFCHSLVSKN